MSNKILPTSAKFYLADDVRTERDGRSTLVGLFPDDCINLTGPTSVDPLPENTSHVFEGCAILAAFDRALGKLDVKIRLLAPDGSTIIEDRTAVLNAEREGTASFSVRLRPFATPAFGTHRYEITVDDAQFQYEFQIKPAPVQQPVPPSK